MTDDDIRPFLPLVHTPTRSLGAALTTIATPEATSPWTPRAVDAPVATGGPTAPPALAGPSSDELAAICEQARERGHADGLAQTAELRAQLAELLAELAAARNDSAGPAAELIAEIAACVVETWTENTPQTALFAPIVREWVTRSGGKPATARVHPADADAFAAAIGDAAIEIVRDPDITPGGLEIRGATLELSHDWEIRGGELRAAIVAALAGGRP